MGSKVPKVMPKLLLVPVSNWRRVAEEAVAEEAVAEEAIAAGEAVVDEAVVAAVKDVYAQGGVLLPSSTTTS